VGLKLDILIPVFIWPKDPIWSLCCPPIWEKSSSQEPN
jgi:hypothetical protein